MSRRVIVIALVVAAIAAGGAAFNTSDALELVLVP